MVSSKNSENYSKNKNQFFSIRELNYRSTENEISFIDFYHFIFSNSIFVNRSLRANGLE